MNATLTESPPGPSRLRPREARDSEAIDAVAAALADRTRRDLLRLVRSDEHSAGALATQFPDISRPAVSQHLRVLRDAGLVDVRADGNRRLYRARRDALAPMSRFIDDMWGDGLQRLRRVAESQERAR